MVALFNFSEQEQQFRVDSPFLLGLPDVVSLAPYEAKIV